MRRFTLLSLLLLSISCRPSTGGDASAPLPIVLQPEAGALAIQTAVFPGRVAEVAYDVRIAYPATAFIASLQDRIHRCRFTADAEDFFNPGLRTGEGWRPYLDHSRIPHAAVHQWSGWWSNSSGGRLHFMLSYRTSPFSGSSPPLSPNEPTLHIVGQLLARTEALRLRGATPNPHKGGA